MNELITRSLLGGSLAFPIVGATLLILGVAGCNPPAEEAPTDAPQVVSALPHAADVTEVR